MVELIGTTQTPSLRRRTVPLVRPSRLAPRGAIGAMGIVLLLALAAACAAVRPEQRAVLADPTMQHEDDTLDAEARQHVLENREGAFGGGSVRGGGCGCN